jgi:hypothetical protein
MKKILTCLPLFFFLYQVIYSQTPEVTGKPIAELFTDFHYNLKDTTKTTGFGLSRAYVGYNFQSVNNFSGSVIMNIGSADELSAGSVSRRYAYFKYAFISWKKDKLNLSLGITGTHLTEFQQKFWGKRYIADTFLSLNGYGYVSDLGFALEYKFNDIWQADFTLMNGEGYSKLQLDNNLKTSAGINITPRKQLAIRLYGDISKPHGTWQYTLVGFAGFKNDLITIGGEASYKSNMDMTTGHNSWGISWTGAITVLKNTELFARYDYSTSVAGIGDNYHWNYLKDNDFAVLGVQYTFNQNVKLALDYQSKFPYSAEEQISNQIFLNALFKF